jgi:hypothetical protein
MTFGLKSFGWNRDKEPECRFSADSAGIQVIRNRPELIVPWLEVLQVRVYNIDLITTTDMALTFQLRDGLIWMIDESHPDFDNILEKAKGSLTWTKLSLPWLIKMGFEGLTLSYGRETSIARLEF